MAPNLHCERYARTNHRGMNCGRWERKSNSKCTSLIGAKTCCCEENELTDRRAPATNSHAHTGKYTRVHSLAPGRKTTYTHPHTMYHSYRQGFYDLIYSLRQNTCSKGGGKKNHHHPQTSIFLSTHTSHNDRGGRRRKEGGKEGAAVTNIASRQPLNIPLLYLLIER